MPERLARKLERVFADMVEGMTRDELTQALDDCDWCTQTNCGWLEFRFAPIVRDAVANQIQLLDEADLLAGELEDEEKPC